MPRHLLSTFFLLLAATFLFDANNAETGTATFYKPPYLPSACYGYQDNGVMIAGASNAIWDNRAACGRHYRVQCIGGTNDVPHPCNFGVAVTVKIVDYCPPPSCNGTINLSMDAFARIANLRAGNVAVSFVSV